MRVCFDFRNLCLCNFAKALFSFVSFIKFIYFRFPSEANNFTFCYNEKQ